MLNVNQMTMMHYRVVSNKEEVRYYFVSADLIKKLPPTAAHDGKYEILKEDDPAARQMLEEFVKAPIVDWKFLVCESKHYLFGCSFKRTWYDWEVVRK